MTDKKWPTIPGIADEYNEGAGLAKLAKRYSMDPKDIRAMLVDLGVTIRKPGTQKPMTPELIETIKTKYKNAGIIPIADELGIDRARVREVLNNDPEITIRKRGRPKSIPLVEVLFDQETRDLVVDMYTKQKLSFRQIADSARSLDLEHELTESRVKTILKLARQEGK